MSFSRSIRGVILAGIYCLFTLVSFFLAYELRFDFQVPERFLERIFPFYVMFCVIRLSFLYWGRQFRGVLHFFHFPDLYRLTASLGASSFVLIILWYSLGIPYAPPRSIILGELLFSLFLFIGFRVGLRVYFEKYSNVGFRQKHLKRTLIWGTGKQGASITADILSDRTVGLKPVGFVSDEATKVDCEIHGVPVLGMGDSIESLLQNYDIEALLLTDSSMPPSKVSEISSLAAKKGIEPLMIPSVGDVSSGRMRASNIRLIDIEDLLPREQVALDSENIRRLIAGKVVLVTGAGGSIGSELSWQIASNNPKRLILLDQAEIQLFNLEKSLGEYGYKGNITYVIADIVDRARLNMLFARYEPSLVFHAAAHKHVPIMESQPSEAIKNNTMGTRNVIDASILAGVERVVMISTDKAINPTNVMGASKRLAEIYLQARQSQPDCRTKLMAVRFGNVLGSSGSVIPVFKKQIAQGGPLTVTHPEVTRYFMTIPEAVGLVLQCGTQGTGGEIFVLDMGTPVKIVDLARKMIELSGYRPEIDIDIEFVGLRPGEKLYEELQHDGEKHAETAHPKIFVFKSDPADFHVIEQAFSNLMDGIDTKHTNDIKREIMALVPEYKAYID